MYNCKLQDLLWLSSLNEISGLLVAFVCLVKAKARSITQDLFHWELEQHAGRRRSPCWRGLKQGNPLAGSLLHSSPGEELSHAKSPVSSSLKINLEMKINLENMKVSPEIRWKMRVRSHQEGFPQMSQRLLPQRQLPEPGCKFAVDKCVVNHKKHFSPWHRWSKFAVDKCVVNHK